MGAHNEGHKTRLWRIHKYNRSEGRHNKNQTSHLVLGVDEESLGVLRSKYNMRPHFYLWRVKMALLDKGAK